MAKDDDRGEETCGRIVRVPRVGQYKATALTQSVVVKRTQ